MFRFKQIIVRDLTVCVWLKLHYWSQLIYFIIELFYNEVF
jgi:hypothetical protein